MRLVSSGLGMRQYPVGAAESADMGDHIMGVVVSAWLSRFAVERWGEAWARAGGIALRFRSHLASGLELELDIDDRNDVVAFELREPGGLVAATAEVHGPSDRSDNGTACFEAAQTPGLLRVKAEELADAVLAPIEFAFDAARDLAFTAELADGPFWRDHGWAHPAWLASASNALIRERVEFAGPELWRHAGLELRMREPVPDRATIALRGHIAEVFERSRHRFAVCAVEACVDDRTVATMRNTFTYASTIA